MECGRDLQDQVDRYVAGGGLADRVLQVAQGKFQRRDLATDHLSGLQSSGSGADQDQDVRVQILQALTDGEGAEEEVLHQDIGPECLVREPFDDDPSDIEIALVELANPADEDRLD